MEKELDRRIAMNRCIKTSTIVMMFFFCITLLAAKTKPALAVFPFTGMNSEDDGDTIALLLENELQLNKVFTIIPRGTVTNIIKEEQFQREGWTNSDTRENIKKLGANFVVVGYIQRFADHNLVLISILNVETLQQITGDYREYRDIEDIRGLLPSIANKLARAADSDTTNLLKLAIFTFDIAELAKSSGVNESDAELLTQILATEITNSGKYVVLPRSKDAIEKAMTELHIQRSGFTDPNTIKAIGNAFNADYVLEGSVRRLGRMYLFDVKILDIETGSQLKGESVEYQNLEDGLKLMPRLAYLLTDNAWKNKWLYFGVRGGGSIRFYTLSDDIKGEVDDHLNITYEAVIQAAFQINKLFAIQTEAIFGFTNDFVGYSGYEQVPYVANGENKYSTRNYTASFDSMTLMIPILAKVMFRPRIFLFSALGGIYFTVPLGKMNYTGDVYETREFEFSVPIGYTVGINLGIKLGPGVLFADARYAADIGNMSIKDDTGILQVYNRKMVSISLGYTIGLINR
ncbi:MAG: hypothetical protein LBU17_11365 [Treponema sp.]|jgi:TolB-like protein|nr:hypothetical protein [Treponema sp.]